LSGQDKKIPGGNHSPGKNKYHHPKSKAVKRKSASKILGFLSSYFY
jgi:hypothetical protein